METSHINYLPGEILSEVCQYLDGTTLLAFSLSNKRCRAAALPVLFDTITIYVWDPDGVKAEVNGWRTILESINGYSFVRVFRLANGVPIKNGRNRPKNPLKDSLYDTVFCGPSELMIFSEQISVFSFLKKEQPGKDGEMQETRAWIPVIDLMHELSGLQRLTYTCSDTLPSFLVDALHRMQQRCCFDTLVVDIPYDHRPEHDNSLQLEAAPYASQLKLKVCGVTLAVSESSGYYRALRRLEQILRASRNAKEAYISWYVPDIVHFVAGSPLYRLAPEVAQEVEELELNLETHLAYFDLLHIRLDACNGPDCFEYWSGRTDFTRLKSLKIEARLETNLLTWLNEHHATFQSLETLVFKSWSPELLREFGPGYDPPGLAQFLRNLEPLRRIRMEGVYGLGTIKAILDQHSKTLQQLWLEWDEHQSGVSLDADLFEALCTKCPVLEDLNLVLDRTRGDKAEVERYKRLGGISTLRRLYLRLNSSRPYVEGSTTNPALDPTFSDFDRQMHRSKDQWRMNSTQEPLSFGCIRDRFINSALDQELAESIFRVIQAGKGPEATLLDNLSLEIMATTGSNYYLNPCDPAVWSKFGFARSYVFTRDQRDTHRNEVMVQEDDGSDELDSPWRVNKKEWDECGCKEIFQRIWPETEATRASGRWWESLRSFPLAQTDDSADLDAPFSEHEQLIFRKVPNFVNSA